MSDRKAYHVRESNSRAPWIPYAVGVALIFVAAALVWIAQAPSSGQSTVLETTATPATSTERTVAPVATEETAPPKPELELQEEPEPASTGIVIAWQPSHQSDTGYNGWDEAAICSDIVDRAIATLPEYEHVKAWETEMGMTGSNNYKPGRGPTNTPAFDSEIAQANMAGAVLFISIHNDGGATTGILGENLPGDSQGKYVCTTLVDTLVAETGLKNRGLREVNLYSLKEGNTAPYKCLLEIGDNEADRVYLEDPAKREIIAQALAKGVRSLDLE